MNTERNDLIRAFKRGLRQGFVGKPLLSRRFVDVEKQFYFQCGWFEGIGHRNGGSVLKLTAGDFPYVIGRSSIPISDLSGLRHLKGVSV